MKTHAIQDPFEFSIDPAALDFSTDASASSPTAPRAFPPSAAPEGKALSLSQLLRILGGLVIVAAFVMYLFQGWREGDDLTRSLLLLGHTVVLTLAGLASGSLLREAKGARLFIALALAVVPVNFAFLGGLTYEHLTWDAQSVAQTADSLWVTSAGRMEAAMALAVTAVSLLILALSVQLGFRIMTRRSAWPLTGLYLAANAVLLIPTRADLVISVTLLGLGGIMAARAMRLRRLDPSLATPEGVLARALLVLPLLVLGGRSVWLYAPDTLFFTVLSLSGYLALRLAAAATARDGSWRGALEACALLLAALGTYLALDGLLGAHSLPDVAKAPLAAAIFAALLVDLSSLRSRWSSAYRGAAALVMALAMLLNLAAFGGFGNALVSLSIGVVILIYGYQARARFIFGVGFLTALTGLGVAGHDALSTFSVGGWSALVLLGITIIVAGSVIERYGAGMRAAFTRWNRHFEREG
jgi:hypothetical protein